MQTALAATTALTVIVASAPATAQSNRELRDIIRQQSEQIERLEQRLDDLETQGAETDRKAEEAVEAAKEADTGVKFKLGPSPTIESKDGRFEFKVRGRVQTDFNLVRADSDDDISTTSTELRRARLGVEGRAWQDIEYKFEVDFAEAEVDVTDAYLEYVGKVIEPVNYVRVGQYKTPNSLSEQTSSRYITFMERAAITDAFDFDRRIGFGVGLGEKNWTFDIGAFSQNDGANSSAVNEGVTLAARGTHKIDLSEDSFLHVGGSVRWRDLDNGEDDNLVQYRQRPFFHDTNRTVDTGEVPADNDVFLGPEFAAVFGPLSFQSEAGWSWVDRADGGDNATELWGAYADVSYFLTGESRQYKGGKFGRPKVNSPVFEGGSGAWETALRFDYIDLNDSDADIKGGRQFSIVPGVNWWLNRHVRMTANFAYTRVFDANPGADDFGEARVGDGSSNNVYGFGVRGQVDW